MKKSIKVPKYKKIYFQDILTIRPSSVELRFDIYI